MSVDLFQMSKEIRPSASVEKPRYASLLSIFRMQCRLLGGRVYLLFALMPFATLSESLGITLLLPLFSTMMDSESGDTGKAQPALGGMAGKVLSWIPLPDSPIWLLGLILLAFLFKALIRFSTDALNGYFQATLMHRLKTKFVDGYVRLSFLEFSGKNTGHYSNIVTGQVIRFSRSFLNYSQSLLQGIAALIYLGVAAVISWRFALVAGVGGLIFGVGIRFINNYVRRISRETAHEQATLNKQLIQVIQALKYLMATGRADDQAEHVRRSCYRLFGYELKTNLARAFSTSIREPLSVLLVLTLVTLQVFVFHRPLPEIFILLLLLHRGTQSAFAVQSNWQAAMEQVGAAEMIQNELAFIQGSQEPRGSRSIGSFQKAIRFEDVSFAYSDSDGRVLHDVSLVIPHNQAVALVGHSGAGKSTLADLLTLLLRPTAGRILIDGVDVLTIDPLSWRKQIAYVCQDAVVFDDTVAANISLGEGDCSGDAQMRRRIEDAATAANLHEYIQSLPDGYETVVGDRGVRFSGGQKQRLFIARELFKQPQLLILDEATSALDGESEKAIQASIDALKGQMTVLLIAHRLATIRNADLIVVLEDGHVVEQGSFSDLHAQGESRFRRMVELQSL
jgi:ABC-type multidrug transport system fused ATPase/permease subunit